MPRKRNPIDLLIARDGIECHYCGRKCIRGERTGGLAATKDHVFPKFLGGRNSMGNYVLACAKCNSDKGNQLFYCNCKRCSGIIAREMSKQDTIDMAFKSLLDFNKPRIVVREPQYAAAEGGRFAVKAGHNPYRHFPTFEEAVDYALNGEHMNRKVYK